MSSPDQPSAAFEQELYNLYAYSTHEYDKNILYIASGAFGISFAFIEKIVPLQTAIYNWILFCGWLLLTVTIMLCLFSHRESKCQTEIYMKKHASYKRGKITIEDLQEIREKCNKEIEKYNDRSAGFLIAGILFILLFLILNLYKC